VDVISNIVDISRRFNGAESFISKASECVNDPEEDKVSNDVLE
jgi:hypothetical protein